MRNIICIGGSTGALEAIIQIMRALPANLPAAVFIVRHISPTGDGMLPRILQPYCALPVADAREGEPIENGRVYVAPSNHHLLLDRKTVVLSSGPRENWSRPAIDPLFRTAAQYHGPQSIGIVLSGKLDDGTAGLWAIKRRGGFAVVQQPADAAAPDMPRNVLSAVEVDAVVDAEEIGALLPEWCKGSSSFASNDTIARAIELENAFLRHEGNEIGALEAVATHPGIVCPDCGGKLWQMKEGPLRYRCHVGHGMSAQTLLAQQRAAVERAGWQYVRALEEEVFLSREILQKARTSDAKETSASIAAEVQETAEKARRLVEARAADSDVPLTPLAEDQPKESSVGPGGSIDQGQG